MLGLINMPAPPGSVRPGAASYGTAAIGPDRSAEVVTFGLVTSTAPDGTPVVIGVRNELQFGPPHLQPRSARGGPADGRPRPGTRSAA